MSKIQYRTCNLCEAMCGLKITYNQQEILKIEGDKEDTFSRGHICPKAYGLKDIYTDPDRLKMPIKKVAGEWQEISWPEAYELAATKIIETNLKHGANAIGVYQGNPSVHNIGTALTASPFFKSLKTKNMYSASSVDQFPHHFAADQMFGHPLLIPITDIDNTDLFVIMGGNPLVSNGSMMTVPDVANRLKAIQKRGGKVIVIDPRFTETAAKADQHIFIKPGGDPWLLAGILNYIFTNKLYDLAHLAAYTKGLDELNKALKSFSIEKAVANSGISEAIIIQLANDIASANKGAVYGRMGVSTQQYGGICNWFINALNIITGNLDKEGGLLFTKPLLDIIDRGKPRTRYNRWQSRVQKTPEFLGEIPVACLSEEIETEGDGQIKMLMTSCGNPVLAISNGKRLDKALEKLDFMVSFDIYLNETTRHADLILPPATGIETAHYDITFNNLAVRNVAKLSPPLFEKGLDAKYDWQIFQELGQVLAKKVGLEAPNGGQILSPEQMIAFSIKNNAYGISFEDLKAAEHGLDLGALKPQLPERLLTEDKKIDLAPAVFLKDLERLKAQKPKSQGYQLIGKRHLRDNNSWMHNSELLQKGKNRCVLLINEADAAKENISNGQMVKVKSRVGEIEIEAKISKEMMPGVVSIPHGYGHNYKGIKLGQAQLNPGVSVNDLTDDKLTDELTGNAAFSDLVVSLN